ncbi:PH domain-containing protein [Nonomuraea sp. NBC_00507]|uniref:PH domain-containing protein n=1 Tax=Nonomuraea sp. NBC_00507 TaxID=2976002 RepID=UPI002E196D3F
MSDELRPDIQAAASLMRNKMGAKREIRRLVEYLWEGEQVQLMSAGQYGQGTGLVALTDRRLLFVKDGIMSKSTEDFPLEKISSVEWSSGMLLGSLTVFASGNKAEITSMDKQDGKQLGDRLRERLASGRPSGAAPAPAPSGGDVYDQLRKLGELRDAGVLTQAEFEEKKTALMRQL